MFSLRVYGSRLRTPVVVKQPVYGTYTTCLKYEKLYMTDSDLELGIAP